MDKFITQHDYQTAIWSQEACNLVGLVNGFAEVLKRISAESKLHGGGTDWINNHPICRLYAEQISHLTRKRDWDEAYSICETHAKEGKMS